MYIYTCTIRVPMVSCTLIPTALPLYTNVQVPISLNIIDAKSNDLIILSFSFFVSGNNNIIDTLTLNNANIPNYIILYLKTRVYLVYEHYCNLVVFRSGNVCRFHIIARGRMLVVCVLLEPLFSQTHHFGRTMGSQVQGYSRYGIQVSDQLESGKFICTVLFNIYNAISCRYIDN